MLIDGDQQKIIGYRYEVTGVFGYKFFSSGNYICTVSSSVLPSPPVIISDADITRRSNFDSHSTIFPGLTRTVNDDITGVQTNKIVYKGKGQYEIDDSVSVEYSEDKYTFYIDGKVAAIIRKIDDKSGYDLLPNNASDTEPYFDIVSSNDLDKKLLIVVLAFPMLAFGL